MAFREPVQEVAEATEGATSSTLAGGPLQEWTKPRFAFFVTGRQHGYIEPCGCTGLENAKGGLSRRYTLLQQLRSAGWDVLALDVGNQVRRFGRQAELKFQTTIDIMRAAKYQAIALGPDDLRLSFDELLPVIAGDGESPTPFVAANVDLLGLLPKVQVVDVGGKRVGITSVLGKRMSSNVPSDNIQFVDPLIGLTAAVAELQQARCDLYVLLAHTDLQETRTLAEKFPMFQLIVTAGGAGEPTREMERVPGSAANIVQVGTKAMFVGVIGVYDDARRPMRYERIALDARFEDSEKVLELFGAYQKQLEVLGLQGLGLRPVPYPAQPPRTFVGHEACGDCHSKAYDVFVNSPHFPATESLVEPSQRVEIRRHFDPECLSCHVTGWNPQEYFPYVSGYLDYEDSEHLHSNGCENCHGPGSLHVAAELGEIDANDAQLAEYREQMRMTLAQARESGCAECHDMDNSPDFHEKGAFEKYWEQVKHYGKD